MGASSITRRSLLRTGAGAFAGIALRPAAALASATRPEPPPAIALGALGSPRTVELPAGVAVVGLQWVGPAAHGVELRSLQASGAWGPWVPAGAHGHGPDARAQAVEHTGEPLWIAGARRVQLRSAKPLAHARLRAVLALPSTLAGDRARAATLPLAEPVLAAGAGQPPIIARSAWARGVPLPRVAPEYGAVELAFVHHTENPNGYSAGQVPAMLRAIFLFHREVNGWNDIGYNFVIDRFGRAWEARAGGIDEAVVGAQAGGYNLVSTGVAILGSYSGTPVSPIARATLQRLLAWKLSLHGTPSSGRVTVQVNPAGAGYSKYPARARVSLLRVSGHRDADSTECPGNALYGQLPAVRARVQRLAGTPVRATLALVPAPPVAPAAPGSPPASAQPPQLAVALVGLDGTPVAGAPVQLQGRKVARRGVEVLHTTLAEGVTDAAGQWVVSAAGFALGAAAPVWVRALYDGGPSGGAAVSSAVKVDPVAAVTSPPAPVPTP